MQPTQGIGEVHGGVRARLLAPLLVCDLDEDDGTSAGAEQWRRRWW